MVFEASVKDFLIGGENFFSIQDDFFRMKDVFILTLELAHLVRVIPDRKKWLVRFDARNQSASDECVNVLSFFFDYPLTARLTHFEMRVL